MYSVFIEILLGAIVVEALTSIHLNQDSLFHALWWKRIQKGLREASDIDRPYKETGRIDWIYSLYARLYKLSICNYCISFWMSICFCLYMFEISIVFPMLVLVIWRMSHYMDAVYRYFLVRSFVANNMDIEE